LKLSKYAASHAALVFAAGLEKHPVSKILQNRNFSFKYFFRAPFLSGDRFRYLISQNHKEIESSSSSGTLHMCGYATATMEFFSEEA
jgi:hypothetical protein